MTSDLREAPTLKLSHSEIPCFHFQKISDKMELCHREGGCINSLLTMITSALNWLISKVISTKGSKKMEEVFKEGAGKKWGEEALYLEFGT